MRNFLNPESSFMVFLTNLTDVVLLNVLCLICCIPIITIGPAVTALHSVTLRMAREEEGYVVKSFFKSFKENFKQSVVVWLIFLVITAVFLLDLRILKALGAEASNIFLIVIGAIYLFVCLTVMYVFPLLARFENALLQTIKNALFMSILHIFKTILMAIIYVIPFILLPMHYNLILVFLLIGVSGPAYINSYLWKSIFRKYEPENEEEAIADDMEFQIPEE